MKRRSDELTSQGVAKETLRIGQRGDAMIKSTDRNTIKWVIEWEEICKELQEKLKGLADIPIVAK